MANFGSIPMIGTDDLYSSSSVNAGPEVGQLVFGYAGTAYRRFLNGAAAAVVGEVFQGPAIDTQFDALVPAAATVAGQTQVTITNGTTAITANQFVGGTLVVNVTPQLAETYYIVGHSTATNGSVWTVTLDRPIRTAWTVAGTRLVARRSPWSGSIKHPTTTLTASVAGVVVYPVAAGEYGWLQTKGVTGVIGDSTSIIAGSALSPNSATAGAATLNTAGFSIIGHAMQAANAGKPIPAYLCID